MTVLGRALALLAGLALASCATTTRAPDSLDAVARDYVLLQLSIGEKEDGYIDAYYGPAELKEQAAAEAGGLRLPDLEARAAALRARLLSLDPPAGTIEARRKQFLLAHLTSARTRLRMLRGEALSFQDEAEGLFGVRPQPIALELLDPVLARIESLLPGEGTLAERVNAFQDRFIIPPGKLRPVMEAAIAECRRRTLAHIALPEDERFDLAFVTDKSWSGYNYYQGGHHSKIEINTDLPVRLDRAIDLGCHEGYPGHHVHSVLLERDMLTRRGWLEFSVNPLYSPQSLIGEGSANYGIDLAFPGDEGLAYERDVLAPLAGLPTADLVRYRELRRALDELQPGRFAIAAQLLDGTIDENRAVELLQRYQLNSAERARQQIAFFKQYRSYVINYGLGQDRVRAWVEAGGADQAARWQRMARVLGEPTLPSDLTVR